MRLGAPIPRVCSSRNDDVEMADDSGVPSTGVVAHLVSSLVVVVGGLRDTFGLDVDIWSWVGRSSTTRMR